MFDGENRIHRATLSFDENRKLRRTTHLGGAELPLVLLGLLGGALRLSLRTVNGRTGSPFFFCKKIRAPIAATTPTPATASPTTSPFDEEEMDRVSLAGEGGGDRRVGTSTSSSEYDDMFVK